MYSQTQFKKLLKDVSELKDINITNLQTTVDSLTADNIKLTKDLAATNASLTTAKADIIKLQKPK